MLHQFLGREPPSKIKKNTCEANKSYDATKRKRTIVPKWRQEFAWLLDDGQVMYCKVCRAVYGPLADKGRTDKYRKYSAGPFVVGSQSLRHDGLVSHQLSAGHKEAEDIHKAKNAPQGQQPAQKLLKTLNDQNFCRLEKLFRSAHAIVKKCRPVSDFQWMCQVDVKKGVDIGQTYRNDKSCKEFIVAMAEVVRKDIEDDLREAKFVSIMSDGSTDVSTIENEICYVHFAVRGRTQCLFLGLIPCEVADAKGIFDALLRSLKFDRLSQEEILKKVVGFIGDGASVNTGHVNGVISLFRQNVSPAIVMVKCMSHRLELAFKDALKTAPLFKKVYDLLDQLFKFYHHSPKQTAGLKKAFSALAMSTTYTTRVGGTRWVSHTKTALYNMLKAYRAMVLHLSQVCKT